MDQDAYRKTFRDMNDRFCLFEKGILSNQCSCSQAERFYLAEREGVHCLSDQGQQSCGELLALLRHHARFTVKSPSDSSALPHAKLMRLQVGGLHGIWVALQPEDERPGPIEDIYALVSQALARFGSLERLPFQEIIKQIAAYQGRRRRPRE